MKWDMMGKLRISLSWVNHLILIDPDFPGFKTGNSASQELPVTLSLI